MFIEFDLVRQSSSKSRCAARLNHQMQMREGKTLRRAHFLIAYRYALFAAPGKQIEIELFGDGRLERVTNR